MLVLSRREQERIVIGEGIEIIVLRVSGNRVRLGIDCDRRIPVRRQELPSLARTVHQQVGPSEQTLSLAELESLVGR